MERPSGVRLVGYDRRAGVPAVTVTRFWEPTHTAPVSGPHAHDFLVLLYVERGGASMHVDGRERTLGEGDALVVAPGAVVNPAPPSEHAARLWTVFFPADAVDPEAGLASWQAHPLLAVFGPGRAGGARRLSVPAGDRESWTELLTSLDEELRERREGYGDAVIAYLTLLLVRLGRLRPDPDGDGGLDPLLAEVLDVVEARFHEPIAVRDVAAAVGLTPGHLSTAVRERTGRTVGGWLLERRMQEARRLLAGTDLTVAEIARRVGVRDVGYFVRRFRAAHGVTPAAWRRA